MPCIIEAHHLHKIFPSSLPGGHPIKALADLSITVEEGEVLGILGPNGAGKTTFLNTLATLLIPDSGTITVSGIRSCPKNFRELRRILNMASGYPNLPFSLTVRENMYFYGRLYGLSGSRLTQKVDELSTMFSLEKIFDRRFDELSSGNKQRLALAKSLLNDPKVLFLDEPTVGLDPDVAIAMRTIIQDVLKAKGVTVLLTTHNMVEAELMCKRVAFIKDGRILHLASPQVLKKMHGTNDLEQVFVHLAKGNTGKEMPALVSLKEPDRHQAVQAPAAPASDAKAWLNRAAAFTFRNYIFAVRNFFSFVELLFWPLVSLISVGLMGDYLKLDDAPLNFIMTGAVAAGVLQVAQLDVSYSLLYEVWSKSVKQTLLAPIGVTENLFGSWVVGFVRGLIVFAVLAICAVTMFHFQFPPLWVTAVFLVGIMMCAFLLGLLVTVLILSFGQKAEITAWMFAYLFMLICGIYYPVDILPPVFKFLADIIPITYFLEFFRNGDPRQAATGFALVVVYFTLGLQILRSAYQRARQKGTIVRLSE